MTGRQLCRFLRQVQAAAWSGSEWRRAEVERLPDRRHFRATIRSDRTGETITLDSYHPFVTVLEFIQACRVTAEAERKGER